LRRPAIAKPIQRRECHQGRHERRRQFVQSTFFVRNRTVLEIPHSAHLLADDPAFPKPGAGFRRHMRQGRVRSAGRIKRGGLIRLEVMGATSPGATLPRG